VGIRPPAAWSARSSLRRWDPEIAALHHANRQQIPAKLCRLSIKSIFEPYLVQPLPITGVHSRAT
jgi:hypothetical protein